MLEKRSHKPKSIEAIINHAAKQAFKTVAKNAGINPKDMPSSRYCEAVTDEMIPFIRRSGLDPQEYHYSGWDLTSHAFIEVFDPKRRRRIVADGSYRQFSDRSTDKSLPPVLISDIDALDTTLVKYGVPTKFHHIWHQAKPVRR
jgi:hypothetical protein